MYFKGLLFCYLLILGFLSLNPWLLPDPNKAIGSITWDLLDHAVAYGGLSILMLLTFKQERRLWVNTLVVFILASFIGVFLEYSQYWFTLNRQFSFFDAVANLFGSMLGILVFWLVRSGRRVFINN